MSDRVRVAVFALCAVAAAGSYVSGIAGRGGPWLAHVVGALALLTIGFFVASGRGKPLGR